MQEMTAWNSAGSGILSAVELELNQSVSISFKIINLKKQLLNQLLKVEFTVYQ